MVTQVKASHILVSSQSEALRLEKKIKGGKSFEDLARKHSSCPSGKKGGDLGYFRKGQMVPEFDAAVFSMEVGAVSAPIKTQFGYHLIKLTDRR